MDSKKILEKAREYRDYTAQNLSKIIQVPAFLHQPKKSASTYYKQSLPKKQAVEDSLD